MQNSAAWKKFEGVDQDGTRHIHYAKFLAALVESQGLVTMERLTSSGSWGGTTTREWWTR